MPGHCKKCGTLLDNGFCHECKTKEPKKILVLYMIGGFERKIHNITESEYREFRNFADVEEPFAGNPYELYEFDTEYMGKPCNVQVPRGSISYFEVREVAE